MLKTVAVIGATGQQGGSVARILLASKKWNVRAITRSADSQAAKALAKLGAEIVVADVTNEASLVEAFRGAHAIYSMTNFWGPIFQGVPLKEAGELEEAQGILQARAASQTPTLEHFIWSTLLDADRLSGGKIPVLHWDYKAHVDDYIQKELPALAAKTTYLFFGMYADSMINQPVLTPLETPHTGVYAWHLPTRADACVSLTGDINVTPGIWVRQILANPEKSLGKYAAVFTEVKTFQEMMDDWMAVTGKRGVIVPVSNEVCIALWWPFGLDVARQLRFGEIHPDWTISVKDRFVGPEELGIKPEERLGHRHALEVGFKNKGYS